MNTASTVSTTLRRNRVISLYRSLLRCGYQWPRWEAPEGGESNTLHYYLTKTIKEEFHASKNETDPAAISEKIERAERELKNLNVLLSGTVAHEFPLVRDYRKAKEQ